MSNPHPIDLVEYGELRGAVAALQTQIAQITERQSRIDGKLDTVISELSAAKGGWRVMMLVGGAASSLGAGFTWALQHLGGKP
jgi:prefoldin subunit 5